MTFGKVKQVDEITEFLLNKYHGDMLVSDRAQVARAID